MDAIGATKDDVKVHIYLSILAVLRVRLMPRQAKMIT